MSTEASLSVLTLNCWGLKFVSKDRQDRLTAIGHYLADATRGYDIVGLQEVWVHDDFLRIQDLVADVLPYSKHWSSGVLGSGLAIFSKFPIVGTTMRRFALNGDPMKFYHGDWYVGKCFVSVVLAHPTCGEIEVFNTHLHAGYDPAGTPDSYLGCRVGEAWEMASLVKAATTQGRHVLSLGDYNSDPNSMVVRLMTKQGGLTDSWKKIHPEPHPIPAGLTPEEGVAIMGVTCDSSLNTWSKHVALNYLTNDAIGERLDYVFYRETPELICKSVEVAVREQISGIGAAKSSLKNYSDHFGVHATFVIRPAVYHFQTRKPLVASSAGSSTSLGQNRTATEEEQELSMEELELIVLTLDQHRLATAKRCHLELTLLTPVMVVCTIGLIISFLWIQPRYVALIIALVLSAFSSAWIVHFLYGFLFGGEMASAFMNTIQEVKTVIHYRQLVEQNARSTNVNVGSDSPLTRVSSGSGGSGHGSRGGLLQK
ncbi:phospholipase C type enzyme [Dissophora globulifera]|uniref:Phospholipase C type enzyme n=1 Tax=Dissophora globulifera TaxID=979702 RepID=A0A9P6RET8_9FUNG|nr:phospholipase C type enzyme [Dissophora globulifera]